MTPRILWVGLFAGLLATCGRTRVQPAGSPVPVTPVSSGVGSISVSPETLAFGTAFVDAHSFGNVNSFLIVNTKSTELEVDAIEIQGSSAFDLCTPLLLAFKLPPGESQEVAVCFDPTSVGTFQGQVVIRLHDAATPQKVVTLTGLVLRFFVGDNCEPCGSPATACLCA